MRHLPEDPTMLTRTTLLIAAAGVALASAQAPTDELYRVESEAEILSAARAIIERDPNCALITVDGNGQPRARTVRASAPGDDMTIWIATRPSTRKVEQIRGHDRVTLFFAVDEELSYVSVMGRATLHDHPAAAGAPRIFDEDELLTFWPDYPEDYLLVRVEPIWLEVLGHGIDAHPVTWRPQAAVPDGR